MSRTLHTFHGGLHLPDQKALSNGAAIRQGPLPAQLIVPLQQHIGAPAQVAVQVGDKVLKGQLIGEAGGMVSAPVHAPSSGTVSAIGPHAVPHPSGLDALCITIVTDGDESWCELHPLENPWEADPVELRAKVREAGIVGLGGAGFPSHVKLNPGARTAVDTLLLNGAECEPYITCDDRLMRERADEILLGARLMRRAINAGECVIAIEDNKPEAIAALHEAKRAAGRLCDIEIVTVPTRYPTGGEKQLIRVVTGKEVRSGGLPIEIGVVCHNVATAAAVYRAIVHGEPLISRVVTVTGEVGTPGNIQALIGTPVGELLAACGGAKSSASRLLMGGPMMGLPLTRTDLPLVKTGNCLLELPAEAHHTPKPCIRCGECMAACPANLLPQQLYWYARAKDFDKAQDYNLFDCIECGCCNAVCPSEIPLVSYYRFAKTAIWGQERERKKADKARERHEFREFRKEREKQERAEALAKKKAALDTDALKKKLAEEKAAAEGGTAEGATPAVDPKQAAIQAALERAKAKKAAAQPKNTDHLTADQQRQIDEAEERRAAAKALADDSQTPEGSA